MQVTGGDDVVRIETGESELGRIDVHRMTTGGDAKFDEGASGDVICHRRRLVGAAVCGQSERVFEGTGCLRQAEADIKRQAGENIGRPRIETASAPEPSAAQDDGRGIGGNRDHHGGRGGEQDEKKAAAAGEHTHGILIPVRISRPGRSTCGKHAAAVGSFSVGMY